MRCATPVDNDPIERARELEKLHTAVFNGDATETELRPVVQQSWRRCLGAQVDPDRSEPASFLPSAKLHQQRDRHPFADMLPLLRENLLGAADEAAHVMILTDAAGHILWREGATRVQRDAEAVQLTEGSGWSEESTGTNAMGTALAANTPVQIHSAEHLVRNYHSWTCAASPVHCPDTGELLGSLDISGPLHTMHPALLALVTTSARLVEAQLRLAVAQRDEQIRERHEHELTKLGSSPGALLNTTGRVLSSTPGHWLTPGERVPHPDAERPVHLADGTEAELDPVPGGYLLRQRPRSSATGSVPTMSLALLDDGAPTATVNGQRVQLTLRHAEILALLALHPEGLTAEQLTLLLHGERGNPTTVRAEIHRLRGCLDNDVVRTKPYRIVAELRTDFGDVRTALDNDDVATVLNGNPGLLLPRSEAPGVQQEREELLVALRNMVLQRGDPEQLWRFCATEHGQHDIEALERLRALLPDVSARRSAVDARLHRLLHAVT